MDKLEEKKIDQHSDEIKVESEEKQRAEKIEVDEEHFSLRTMAIHEYLNQDGEI